MDHYIKVNKIKNFKKYISDINKKQQNLKTNVDKDQKKIFIYLLSILYTVYCSEGIRNKKITEHDNFILTNFAINIRNFGMKKKVKNILKEEHIAYNSYSALENILYTFNKFIDTSQTVKYDNDMFILDNMNKINNLYFTIGTQYTNIGLGYGYYIDFKNINIIINNNNIKRKFKFNEGRLIRDIGMVDFLTMSCTDMKDELCRKIPTEIICMVNNKKTVFKLETASISISGEDAVGHAVTGIICNDMYYIYDPYNNYFKINWYDLTGINVIPIKNYYKIISARKYQEREDIDNNKTILEITEGIKSDIDVFIEYAIYYNTELDFSYKMKHCKPNRPV